MSECSATVKQLGPCQCPEKVDGPHVEPCGDRAVISLDLDGTTVNLCRTHYQIGVIVRKPKAVKEANR